MLPAYCSLSGIVLLKFIQWAILIGLQHLVPTTPVQTILYLIIEAFLFYTLLVSG